MPKADVTLRAICELEHQTDFTINVKVSQQPVINYRHNWTVVCSTCGGKPVRFEPIKETN